MSHIFFRKKRDEDRMTASVQLHVLYISIIGK